MVNFSKGISGVLNSTILLPITFPLASVQITQLEKFLSTLSFKEVVSYTTRGIRENETNGVEHFFISNEQADELLKDDSNIAAYTRIGDNRYFVTNNQIEDITNNLYVIDPKGILNMVKKYYGGRKFIIFYINTSDKIRLKRFEKRQPNSTEEEFINRCKAEDEQFIEFENNDIRLLKYKYGICTVEVDNSYKEIYNAISTISKTLKETYYDKKYMYLIVGRTCSGKDTICKTLIEKGYKDK